MKDNFSTQSNNYAHYRPDYPLDFFNYLKSILVRTENAWDCGTGNGQIAKIIASHFKYVFATDISQSQLDNAIQVDNIFYSCQSAEKTNFPDNFFDLIIVAQAIHWFDFEKFYSEVKRTARQNSLLLVVGYSRPEINEEIDNILNEFYFNIIGEFWDKERKFVDENYLTIPFPFVEMTVPKFRNNLSWTFEHLVGYLETWSAVKHYSKTNHSNPVNLILENLKESWGEIDQRIVSFPMLLRIGKI